MRSKNVLRVFVFTFCLFLAGCFMPAYTQAATNLSAKVYCNVRYYPTLQWSKKSVSKYYIYRASSENGKYKKIATVSGKKTSYTDKKVSKNKTYYYRVKGYKSGKLKYDTGSGKLSSYTGLETPAWYVYESFFAFSKSSIKVSNAYHTDADIYLPWRSGGMVQDGYQIYRKETGTKNYKLIKTIKSSKISFTYTDNTVTSGKSYDYKYRTYKKVYYKKNKRKIIYSKFSSVYTRKAVTADFEGCVKLNQSDYSIDVTIHSKSSTNRDLYLLQGDVCMGSPNTTLNIDDGFPVNWEYSKCSLDGGNTWNRFTSGDCAILKAGGTIVVHYDIEDLSYYSQEKVTLIKKLLLTDSNVMSIPVIYEGYYIDYNMGSEMKNLNSGLYRGCQYY